MIEIICIRGEGDKEAQAINDPLITIIPIAVRRGKQFIDDNWYMTHRRTIVVPYKDNCNPNNIVHIVEGSLGIDALHRIINNKITITREGIWSILDVESYIPGDEI